MTYQFLKSRTFGDIDVFQNLLEKRSLFISFFIFDEVINKVISGQQIMRQSCEPDNYFTNHHHFAMNIAGQNFNCGPCLQLEILGEHICFFYTTYSLFLWPLCLHTCSGHFCADLQVFAVQKFHFKLKNISYMDRIEKLKCDKMCFVCEA